MFRHDVHHPSLKIRSCHPRYTSQRRSHAEFTYLQNAFGINLAFASQVENFFIAGSLALLDQARSQPPNQWVKPEDRFDNHVNRGRQIVAPAHMPQFMRENRFQMRLFKMYGDSLGPEQYRIGNAEDSRLQPSLRCNAFNRPA